jgi:hypothetical protein
MLRKILVMTLALVMAAHAAVYAAGADLDNNNTTTTTESTSTSTSNSTSSSTSTSTSNSYSSSSSVSYSTSWLADKYVGDIWLGYQVHGYAYETGAGSAQVGWINYYYNNTRSGLELLTQGPSLRASGDANAWNPHVYLPGREYIVTTNTSHNRTYGTVSAAQTVRTDVSHSSSVSASQQVSQQVSQQTSQQVSQHTSQQVSTSNFSAGDVIIGTNTNINTNVNTNTNTNVNTNVNTHVNTNYNTNQNTNYNAVRQQLRANTTYDVYHVVQEQYVSPIVLDLSGTGVLDASGGKWLPHGDGIHGNRVAMFDIRGNGFPMAMEWVGPKAGLLIEPKADGTVDGTCLFGQADGFSNGFQKMSVRDKNSDGRLTGAELNRLGVWVDTNGNAIADNGEIRSLASLKITELSVQHKSYKSSFVMNGKTQTMWDWFPTCLDVRKTGVATR